MIYPKPNRAKNDGKKDGKKMNTKEFIKAMEENKLEEFAQKDPNFKL